MKKVLSIGIILLCSGIGFAQQGKDGSITITTSVVVNEYTSLTSDASAGNNFITVSSSALNYNNRFPTPLKSGDLIMIIQMQGAAINGTANDSTWGEITNYNNCGLYEFAEVKGIPGATIINLSCQLKNNYTASGKVQIIRIPRYTNLNVNSTGILTTDSWNGTTGGVLVVEVTGAVFINTGGKIDVTGKGFRGGAVENTDYVPGVKKFVSAIANEGGQKGEGAAGYQTDYTVYGGMYGRGAPANGGGGGNSVNSSGGGGANAGNISAWTGNGNPDITNPSWISAWNLEYNGFANSSSSGGGRGGYGWSFSEDLDALTVGPGDTSWAYHTWWGYAEPGAARDNIGGKGGRPLDYSNGRIFLGGGGGAGHQNNYNAGAGGEGGGIIYILSYGDVSGEGEIISNGSEGQNSPNSSLDGDGVGGGGGGGTVFVNAAGVITGIAIKANGGKGGNHYIVSPIEGEGGGGGGGGGYIAISNGSVNRNALGGLNGITTVPIFSEFPPNGGTKGGDGMSHEITPILNAVPVIANVGPDVTICPGEMIILSASGTGDNEWSPEVSGNAFNPIISPLVTTSYTLTVTSNGCTSKDEITITVDENKCNESEEIYIPNAFTPNGDNDNDNFYVYSLQMKSIYIRIFNRWGNLLFESKSLQHGWDGTYKDQQCQESIYICVVNGVFYSGNKYNKVKEIALIK